VDSPSWEPLKNQPGTFKTENGVVDSEDIGTKMYVQLYYQSSIKTKIKRFKFSLFLRRPYGLDRIYQLDVVQFSKAIKDMHKRSHEHYGDTRTVGQLHWENWQYDDVLAYFCSRTGLVFEPQLTHPEHFELKG
jgi:hypothetical protein